MKKFYLLISLCLLAVGAANADSGITVNFPSNNSYYCAGSNCGFMGSNSGLSGEMSNATDYITETFVTGQSSVSDLTADFGVVDDFGGVPGATYESDLYINGVWVAYFELSDCDYCNTLMTISGTVEFAAINGSGSYTISIYPDQTTDPVYGWEQFSVLNPDGSPSTVTLSSPSIVGVPEPGSLALLGPGILALAGFRRRLVR